MRIEKVEAFVYKAPLIKPYKTALAEVREKDHLVVVIQADGLKGFGEVAPLPQFAGETGETEALIVKNQIAPHLVEEDPFNLWKIIKLMDQAIYGFNLAKSAVEFALCDLIGKALKTPVYNLLGGKFREKVPVTWPIGQKSGEEIAKEALEAVKRGFKAVKLKIGSPKIKNDLENVRILREAVGEKVSIRVDANQAYTPERAIEVIKKIEKYDLQYVEQPVPKWDLHGMAKVRRSVSVPIMADESIFNIHDLMRIIRLKAADVINLKVGKVGGLFMSRKIALVSEAAGLPCMVGSMLEGSIGTMAGAHLAIATRNVTYESELVCHTFYKVDVVKNMPKIEDGCLIVPSKPGLGLEVDEEKLREISRRYG